MTTPVRGLLVDLDGVVRLWTRHSAVRAARECSLPDQAVRAVAYDGSFDLAHHGFLTHAQWVGQVRERLTETFGPNGTRAADLWSGDRGDIDSTMVELLQRARTAGLVLAVLTNNTTAVHEDLALHQLGNLFDHVANSAETGLTKPAPAAYRTALEMMRLPAGAVAFTDDNPTNVTAAQHLGLHAHPYTSADAFESYLTGLGVTLAAHPPALPHPRRAPGSAPPAGHAETDEHTGGSIRYLATVLPPAAVAAQLTAHHPAALAVPLYPGAVASVSTSGHLTTWRLLPAAASAATAAGHLSSWTDTPCDVEAEHLPPWLPDARAAAASHAESLLHHIGWALHHLSAQHHDRLAAATLLDTVRQHLTALTTLLARHQHAPWPGATATRYLPLAARTVLTASLRADTTTPAGLTTALTELLALLRDVRFTVQAVLDTHSSWPWQHTAAALAPLLGAPPDLSAQPSDNPLYTPALAAVYDAHRAVAEPMATALRTWAADELDDCDVVELGAGTGRITRLLAGIGSTRYQAVEPSPAMADLLAAARLPGVEIIAADALMLPLPDACADVVVEHEALQFTADPLRAAEEAVRVLRPRGRFIRLLLHPAGTNPLAGIDTAYREAAFADGPRPLFYGKGTDQRVTDHLTARGLPTQTQYFPDFTHQLTAAQALNALADRAWPYQHQLTPCAHTRGLHAAQQAATNLTSPTRVTYTLRALITRTRKEAH